MSTLKEGWFKRKGYDVIMSVYPLNALQEEWPCNIMAYEMWDSRGCFSVANFITVKELEELIAKGTYTQVSQAEANEILKRRE